MSHFWLSFCDPARPAGEQFLGVAIIAAEDFENAVMRAHELGINPGGEVRGLPVPADSVERVFPHSERLLSRAYLQEAGLLKK